MGQSQSVSCSIEIEASPAAVRSVFLDFPRLLEWSQWTIEASAPGKHPTELKAGDGIKAKFESFKFPATITENTTEHLEWVGSLPGILTGTHGFYFYPSSQHPGSTTFTQKETLSGLLAFVFGPGWSRRKNMLENWNVFNADLKREVEKNSY
ncbi:hypothetical protein B0J13DRAFT_143162 [Dactylonectria estremocensis]|uniref:Polyketide cyclase/dehydrase n=1 Tax=Dactylonectria estremocensis TaxID=1079267 RepID=A0A9P9IMK0_9HYPO|nr:hypothetical protein B0J13DRAFT_143162 [Dactylonectria estremocensis]